MRIHWAALVVAVAAIAPGGATATYYTALSAGALHNCAVTSATTLRCWGSNSNFQLGDRTYLDRAGPVDNAFLTGVVSLAAGDDHNCVIIADRRIRCWGSNHAGQLGVGTFTTPYYTDAPSFVPGITGAVQLAVGINHTCSISDQGVLCWGFNDYGQLGDGTTTHRQSPVAAGSVRNDVTRMSAGYHHTCATTQAGRILCWGDNTLGQLGDGTNTRRLVGSLNPYLERDVADVVTGFNHTCVRMTQGTVKCWGANDFGQLGDATTTNRTSPVDVSGLSGVTAISSSWVHTCAIASGAVQCWGNNSGGQLGDGTTTHSSTPRPVRGLEGDSIVTIAAGSGHTCALLATGAIKCWGGNVSGQLGAGSTAPQSGPVKVFASGEVDRNFQGLWWRAGGSESGWGLNVVHQADVIFATWFTYDRAGKPVWFVASNVERVGTTQSYAGALYRTTGPSHSAQPWNPAQVTVTSVGAVRIDFTDESHGTFTAVVDGTTVVKPIERQVFAARGPCLHGAVRYGYPTNVDGLWWVPTESGWGLNLVQQGVQVSDSGAIVFGTWFTYDASGQPTWFVIPNAAQQGGGLSNGALFRTTGPAFDAVPWDPKRVVTTEVGTARFVINNGLSSGSNSFTYSVDGITQTRKIERQEFRSPTTVCLAP